MPALRGDLSVHAYAQALSVYLARYGAEKGDYPKNAREVVERLGPRMLAEENLKLSIVDDGVLLIEGPRAVVEIGYHYVSPDTPPFRSYRPR
jgi:hypothetical protein